VTGTFRREIDPMNRRVVALIGVAASASFAAHAGSQASATPAYLARAPYMAPRFRGERPSYASRVVAGTRRNITFPGQIQHVVLIYMENRTPDDLFSGYYNVPFPTGGTYGSALDLANPAASPTLAPNPIGAYFDPDHSHSRGFVQESLGHYKSVYLGCAKSACPAGASVYSYVPAPEPSPYIAMISNFAYANHVLQANAGPSFVAHQYAIAGQSGGIDDDAPPPYQYAPNAQSENPTPTTGAAQRTEFSADAAAGSLLGNCFSGTSYSEETLNMQAAFPGTDGDAHPPCAEYTTILDEITSAYGAPTDADWQYVASATNSIWAAPMAIDHLYSSYKGDKRKVYEPFAVDPDAVNFVDDLYAPSPPRPFAALTYLTPCAHESDHPLNMGAADGPAWLAYVVNAIGESAYWPTTTIIVTWDDWGGFYDHYRPSGTWPYHPIPNPYGNANDTNEWGFRVPLIVISPYVTGRGYVSTKLRSQSAILNYVESTFGLGSLSADDMSNGNDNLGDLFNFANAPLPYVPVTGGTTFNPQSFTCGAV
jgi:phospholipase C